MLWLAVMYQVIEKQLLVVLFALAGLSSIFAEHENTKNNVVQLECSDLGDCPTGTQNCHKICGCDRFAAFYYNETSGECMVSFKHLMVAVLKKYATDVNDMAYEQGMSEKIEIEAERIFNALLISVLLFIICSVVCVVSAGLYCFRINYTDYRLKRELKDLAKQTNTKAVKKSLKRPQPGPGGQSCNIVCEDAGVFVV